MRRFVFLIPIIALIIFLIIIGLGGGGNTATPETLSEPLITDDNRALRSGALTLKGQTISIDIADSDYTRRIGLSGREELAENAGMWFIFEESAVYPFWMKGMLLDIDIIWVNSDQEIVFIENNATPESFPNSFDPRVEAKYVLEVNDEFTEAHEVSVGDVIEF